MSKKYKVITKEDVLKVISDVITDIGPCTSPIDIINVCNIASILKTSRYQVKKHINELRKEGLIELRCEFIDDDEELYPPYWGYGITDKGKQSEIFKNSKEYHERIFNEWVEACERGDYRDE